MRLFTVTVAALSVFLRRCVQPLYFSCSLLFCVCFAVNVLATDAIANSRGNIYANADGYVDAQVCANCHQSHHSGFQHVGMSQSFGVMTRQWFTPERLQGLPFYHAPSKRYYDISFQGEQVFFQRYQLDINSKKINDITIKIDYYLGSGNKAVAFLFRTQNDELYHLPINWYAEPGFWEMAPGYEKARHFGLSKKVLRECMFCHNAYPQEQMEVDLHWQRDTYPTELKSGIDCQRCHGPGQDHINTVLGGRASLETIRHSIVNPARLPAKERDSVCLQCHLLPTVTLSGQRRFDRGDYSFRPGEVLSDYLLHVDVEDAEIPKSERFEINHHGYRMLQSQCYNQSNNELTCISCHNPHEKLPQKVFYQNVDNKCIECHQDSTELHTSQVTKSLTDKQSCVTCHMPQRRTQDVIHAVMTDHKIGIYPDKDALLAPLTKQEPALIGVELFDEQLDLDDTEREVYQLVTLIQTVPTLEYINNLKTRLIQLKYAHLRPYIVLVQAQLTLRLYDEALATLNFMKNKFGSNLRIAELFATVNVASGRFEEAEQGFKWLLGLDGDNDFSQGPAHGNAELYMNYGLLKYKQKAYEEALSLFHKASVFKANSAVAIMYQALSKMAMGDEKGAIEMFIHSLNVEPLLDRSYYHLVTLLHNQDRKDEAKRYYQSGLKNSQNLELLQKLSSEPGKGYLSTAQNENE